MSAERLVRPEMAITVGRQAQSSTHSGQLRERGPTESRAAETEVAEAKAMTVLSAGSSSVSGVAIPMLSARLVVGQDRIRCHWSLHQVAGVEIAPERRRTGL